VPTARYLKKNGKQVPGASTIAGIGKESGGLVHAAWKLGMEGLNYRDVWGAAATAGTIGHALVEAAIRGTEPEFPTDGAAALGMTAFEAYKQWQAQSKIKWTDTELSLVSEEYGFGGTIDAIGIEEGANTYCLGDWKTGTLYPEHLCQVAAYGRLFEEATGHAVGSYHLCRFNRDTGNFTHARYGNLDKAWEVFLVKKKLHEMLPDLKRML
jgi:hypothetical protein